MWRGKRYKDRKKCEGHKRYSHKVQERRNRIEEKQNGKKWYVILPAGLKNRNIKSLKQEVVSDGSRDVGRNEDQQKGNQVGKHKLTILL